VELGIEQAWVERAQRGDRDAFAALVERYWSRVQRWLHRLTCCSHAAEDLTQEVFLKAWRALASLRAGVSFRGWVFRIARNCFLDRQRAQARALPVQPLPPTAVVQTPGPVATVLHREGQALLQEACDRLPFNFRAAFLLWTGEGLSYAEIAQALGGTEETARWRVFKARHLLAKQLRSYLDREPS
jgi:RNA polymerase sigma-70 factor (ECF subfamily)